jgi:hypothetical protein
LDLELSTDSPLSLADLTKAIRFWKRFSNVKEWEKTPEFLSNHPADKTRITLINRYLTRAKLNYNALKVRYGLGKTIRFNETESTSNKKESKFQPPKSVPGISAETLR